MIAVHSIPKDIDQFNIIIEEFDSNQRIVEAGHATTVGQLGEAIFADWLSENHIDFQYVGDRSFNYDFEIYGKRIDVKTRGQTVPAQPHYMVNVPEYSHQECDGYFFVGVINIKQFQLFGGISRDSFFAKAQHTPTKGNGALLHRPAKCLPIHQLTKPQTWINYAKKLRSEQ